jgi:hypothetical protein
MPKRRIDRETGVVSNIRCQTFQGTAREVVRQAILRARPEMGECLQMLSQPDAADSNERRRL